MTRIIDWNAVGGALLEFLFCGFLGLAQLGESNGLSVVLLPVVVLAFIALIQKLSGVVFDPQADTLRFFSFWVLKRIALSEIEDANCEFGIPISPTKLIFAVVPQSKKGSGRSPARHRTYMVNLSGPFGSRQIRFHQKRWRDRFLNVLRHQAPYCRITRWR